MLYCLNYAVVIYYVVLSAFVGITSCLCVFFSFVCITSVL